MKQIPITKHTHCLSCRYNMFGKSGSYCIHKSNKRELCAVLNLDGQCRFTNSNFKYYYGYFDKIKGVKHI